MQIQLTEQQLGNLIFLLTNRVQPGGYQESLALVEVVQIIQHQAGQKEEVEKHAE